MYNLLQYFKKKSRYLVLLAALFFILSGCQYIKEISASWSGSGRLEPVIQGIAPGIPQGAITEYHVAEDTYIKELKIAFGETACENGWEEKGEKFIIELNGEQKTAMLCAKYNGDAEVSGANYLEIPQQSITEYHIAPNTYIKDIAFLNESKDCASYDDNQRGSEEWIERSTFTIKTNAGFGCVEPQENRYKLCVKYNGDGTGADLPGVEKNSITEYHIKENLMLEDIALADKDFGCTSYGEEFEFVPNFFSNETIETRVLSQVFRVNPANEADIELCFDKTDADVEENIVLPCETIIKKKEEMGSVRGTGVCQAVFQGEDRKCVETTCTEDTSNLDILHCVPGTPFSIDCDYTNYENVNEGVNIKITCCSETIDTIPVQVANECVTEAAASDNNFDAIEQECINACDVIGESVGWTDESKDQCKNEVGALVDQIDTGREEMPLLYGDEGITGEKSQACNALGLEGRATEACIGCCAEATGIPYCCYQDITNIGTEDYIGCYARPQEIVTIQQGSESITAIFQYTPNVNKFKVWLEVGYDETNVPISGYEVEAVRVGDTDTFTFVDRNNQEWSFDSDLTQSCSYIAQSVAESDRCITKGNELSVSSPDLRISCGIGYAIAGIIIEDLDKETPEKQDIKARCCPLMASTQ